jgi:hypothetical protein
VVDELKETKRMTIQCYNIVKALLFFSPVFIYSLLFFSLSLSSIFCTLCVFGCSITATP